MEIAAQFNTAPNNAYVNDLKKVLLYRLMEQLSDIYSSIKMETIDKLVQPLNLSSFEVKSKVKID